MAGAFLEQVRRNSVALISLAVAITSLSYNTWRNEETEYNRNQRVAAFEILLKLGELQQTVFHVHYDKDFDKGNPRTGWAYVLTINDLAQILPETPRAAAAALLHTWGENWEDLSDSQGSLNHVMQALDTARNRTLELLRSLD